MGPMPALQTVTINKSGQNFWHATQFILNTPTVFP